MAEVRPKKSSAKLREMKPATTPEARENQLIFLATELAEQQLRDGTASSQVITHYLKLGSTKERLDMKAKEEEIKLLKAKTAALESEKRMEGLISEALAAFRSYGVSNDDDDDEDYETESEDY